MTPSTHPVVVITGASAGVGRAVVREVARRRARIGLLARGIDGLEAARREVEAAGGQAVVLVADVADAEAVECAAATVEERFGPIDVWVNNAMACAAAGIAHVVAGRLDRRVCHAHPIGRYSLVEKVATFIALLLACAAVAGAATRFPSTRPLLRGMVPGVPQNVKFEEVLPWVGFALAGAAGLMWYSYWLVAKGYGSAASKAEGKYPEPAEDDAAFVEPKAIPEEQRDRLRGWLRQMTLDNTVAVVGTLVPTVAFLILGTQLLRPKGLLPEEKKVAETLGRLLGDIWGPAGYWFLVVALLGGFTGTLLSLHDGFGRLFAHGSGILLHTSARRSDGWWMNESHRRRAFVVILGVIAPAGLFLSRGEPVGLLKIAGAIGAAHIPVVTWLTLHLNRRFLPAELGPSLSTAGMTFLAGLFFAAFALCYLLQLLGVLRIGGLR
jgi:hypothetical protein